MKVCVVTFLVGLVTSAAALPNADSAAGADAIPGAVPDADPAALPDAAAQASAASISLSDPESRLEPKSLQGDAAFASTSSPFFGYKPVAITASTTTTTESSDLAVSSFARAHRQPSPAPIRIRPARILRTQLGRARNRAAATADLIKRIPVTFGKRTTLRDSIKSEVETTTQPEQDPDKPVFPSSQQALFKPGPLFRTPSPTSKRSRLRVVKRRPLFSKTQSIRGPQTDALQSSFVSQPSVRSHRFAPSQSVLSPSRRLSQHTSRTFPSPALHFPREPHRISDQTSINGFPVPFAPHRFSDQTSINGFPVPFAPNPRRRGRVLGHNSSQRLAVPSTSHIPQESRHPPRDNSIFLSAPQEQFQPVFGAQPVYTSRGVPTRPTPQPLHHHHSIQAVTPSPQVKGVQLLGAYILPDAHYKPRPRKIIHEPAVAPQIIHEPAVAPQVPAITQAFPTVQTPSHHQPIPATIATPHAPSTPALSRAQDRYDVKWAVRDDHHGTHFNQYQTQRQGVTRGSYSVLLPDGRLQTVNYYVDGKSGYVAEVSYSRPGDKAYGQGQDGHSNYAQG